MTVIPARRIAGLAAVLVAAGLTGAACGDGEASALTPEELVAEADAICAAGNARMEEAILGLGPDADQAAFDFVVEHDLLPSLRQQVEELSALEPPATLDAEFGRFLATTRGAIARAEVDPAATAQFESVTTMARDLGLTSCGDQ